jgi:hypothetical protein
VKVHYERARGRLVLVLVVGRSGRQYIGSRSRYFSTSTPERVGDRHTSQADTTDDEDNVASSLKKSAFDHVVILQ